MKKSIFTIVFALLIPGVGHCSALGAVLKEGTYSLDFILLKLGIKSNDRIQVRMSIENSLRSLSGGDYPSESHLQAIFKSDSELSSLLEKDIEKLTNEDISLLLSRLGKKSEAEGSSRYGSCSSQCVSDDLDELGIEHLVRQVSLSTSEILKDAPKVGKKLNSSLKRLGQSLSISDLTGSKSELSRVADVERRLLYAALKKMKSGTRTEKALGRAIIKFSSVEGETKLLRHSMWKLLVSSLDDAEMKRWSELLTKIAKEKPQSKFSRMENLRAWFSAKEKSGPKAAGRIQAFKHRNCFGIF